MTIRKYIPVFLLSLLLPWGPCEASAWLDVPLGYEDTPGGIDGFFPYFREKRPKIALALSGGGARGLAHIGVLKVLERHGLPVDGIAGTSMGAIVGSLYAMGYSASEIDSITRGVDWDAIVRDAPPRRQLYLGQKEQSSRAIVQARFEKRALDFRPAVTSGIKLTTALTDLLLKAPLPYPSDLAGLGLPLSVVTTDLLTGRKVVLRSGSLIDALRATLAIPLLFTPLDLDTALLVDGGLLDNLPVEEARALGADLVIAVDTSSKLRPRSAMSAPWEIADQVTTIMQRRSVQDQILSAEVMIQPSLEGVANTDFGDLGGIVAAGEAAAEKIMPRVDSLLSAMNTPGPEAGWKVNASAFVGLNRFRFSRAPEFSTPIPGRYTISELAAAGRSLYQTGWFERVAVRLDTAEGRLYFFVTENPVPAAIRFRGNRAVPDSLLLGAMRSRAGEMLNTLHARADARSIRSRYRGMGFSLAGLESAAWSGDTLVLCVDEGRLSSLRFEGNRRTRPFVIQRELPLSAGDAFTVSRFRQGVENLYSTGYFETIRFGFSPERDGHALLLRFREQGFSLLRAGLRYDLERLTQGFLEATEENLFGAGAQGALTGVIGPRDRVLSAALAADQIFRTQFTGKLSESLSSRDYGYYEDFEKTGSFRVSNRVTSISLGQQMRRFGTLSVELRDEHPRVRSLSGDKIPGETLHLRDLTLRSVVDTRDQLPFPTSGKVHVFEYETSLPFLGSETAFTRMVSSMESYVSLRKGLVLRPRLRWGTADLTTPFAKLYRLGGFDSFFGIHEHSMVGRQFITGSAELRVRVPSPGWLEGHVSVRYDLGSAWSRYTNIQSRDFRQGLGLTVAVKTPFGPVQWGAGWMRSRPAVFYFSAGHSF